MTKVRDYKEHLLAQLQDPKEADAYLKAALHDDDHHVFLVALRDIADIQKHIENIKERKARF